MVTTMKRMFVLIVMALVMLAGLIGWTTMRMEMPVPVHHAASIHASHLLADGDYICPPPPFNCHG